MDKSNGELATLRDTFRKSADILDEMINMEDTDENKEKIEALFGKFIVEMIKLQSMGELLK